MWDTPTASTDLNTLIREERLSTSNILTISVEAPTWYRSFVLISSKLPSTLKKVTIPVAPAVPIPCDRIRRFEEIPMTYESTRSSLVVDNPPTLTRTLFCKLSEVDAIPINDALSATKVISDIVSFDTLISEIEPFTLVTLAFAWRALLIFSSKTILSFTW